MNRIESKFKRPNKKACDLCNRTNLRRAGIVLLGTAFGALFAIKSEFTADAPDIPSNVELKATVTILEESSNAQVEESDVDSYDEDEEKDEYADEDVQLPLTWEEAILKTMTQTKQTQIENYRKGTALMLNIHATHHGGTTFCSRIGRNGLHHSTAPGFACMHDRDHAFPGPEERGCSGEEFCKSYYDMSKTYMPWSENQTGPFVEAIRPYFHMTSWEFAKPAMIRNHHLDDPDWDYPNLLSVIITRHPLSRLLAGDGRIKRVFPGYDTGELCRERWWDYAAYRGRKESDNFFLRILASEPKNYSHPVVSNHVTQGIERTTDELMSLFPTGIRENHFWKAKYLLDKMTIVLDIECLTEGMDALGNLLGLDLPNYRPKPKHLVKTATPRERIGYEDVYEYLEAKHKWDIALYEYSKTISLVKCDDLEDRPAAPTKLSTDYHTSSTDCKTSAPTYVPTFTAEPTTAATSTSTITATSTSTIKPAKTAKKKKATTS